MNNKLFVSVTANTALENVLFGNIKSTFHLFFWLNKETMQIPHELFCFWTCWKGQIGQLNGISLSGQIPLSVKSLFSWWCFSSSHLLLTRCTERDRAGMVKAQWGIAEVGWPLTLALTLFLLDGGHWGSRGCLLIPTIQPFPQAMVGRKTPWSSSHHLKAFQHGPAGQGQVPQWRGNGRKQEREKKIQ